MIATINVVDTIMLIKLHLNREPTLLSLNFDTAGVGGGVLGGTTPIATPMHFAAVGGSSPTQSHLGSNVGPAQGLLKLKTNCSTLMLGGTPLTVTFVPSGPITI